MSERVRAAARACERERERKRERAFFWSSGEVKSVGCFRVIAPLSRPLSHSLILSLPLSPDIEEQRLIANSEGGGEWWEVFNQNQPISLLSIFLLTQELELHHRFQISANRIPIRLFPAERKFKLSSPSGENLAGKFKKIMSTNRDELHRSGDNVSSKVPGSILEPGKSF